MRFDSPAITNAAYLLDVKDDFDVLYAEAAVRRRMMSISTHDRISGIPGRVKLIEEFIKCAQKLGPFQPDSLGHSHERDFRRRHVPCGSCETNANDRKAGSAQTMIRMHLCS